MSNQTGEDREMKEVAIEADSLAAAAAAVPEDPAGATPTASEEALPSYFTKGKKRFVIMFGYSGIGYHGLQINPAVKTIEGDLEVAICKTGVIKKENIGDHKKRCEFGLVSRPHF